MLVKRISLEGEVATRLNGNPWSDGFYSIKDVELHIEYLEHKGYHIQRLGQKRKETWGGPAHPPMRKRTIIAIAKKMIRA